MVGVICIQNFLFVLPNFPGFPNQIFFLFLFVVESLSFPNFQITFQSTSNTSIASPYRERQLLFEVDAIVARWLFDSFISPTF